MGTGGSAVPRETCMSRPRTPVTPSDTLHRILGLARRGTAPAMVPASFAGDRDVAEVCGSGDRTACHRRGLPRAFPRRPDDGPGRATRRRRAVDARRTAGPAGPRLGSLRAVRGSAGPANPEGLPLEDFVNREAVPQLHGLNYMPGAGHQAGPASLPTPSQRPTTTGRLCAAEAPPSQPRPPRPPRFAVLPAPAALLAACSKPAAPAAFERPPAPVRVEAAVARDVPVYLDEIGHAAAKETVWVRPQVGGRVETVHYEDGAELKKGDVLVTLDARPYEARLAAAEATLLRARVALERAHTATGRPQAELTRAKAVLELAKSELARTEKLLAASAASQSDYEVRKNAVEVAVANVSQAEADLKQAEPDERQAEAEVKQAE